MRCVVKIILLLSLLLIACSSHSLDSKFNVSEINKMAGDDYKDKFEILKVIEANNIVAVFINPPYREFPNVIFYKLINGKDKRIIEGLTIGITDTKSDFLDLHTKGQGIDLTSEPTGNYDFDSNDIQKIIRVLKANNSPIIVY